MARKHSFCFTINNPERARLFTGLPDGAAFIVYQLERGAQGTPHLQGYVRFRNAIPVRQAIAIIGHGAHVEACVAGEAANIAYCTKESTRIEGPFEFGERATPGRRTDLIAAAQAVRRTGTLSGVEDTMIIKYARGLRELASMVPPAPRERVNVICSVGTTGIGKTFIAYQAFPNIYRPTYGNGGLWWNGYEAQEVILFDEFEGQVPLTKMLQLLDPYPCALEVKGGQAWARYTTVIITSNREPHEWYPGKFAPGANIGIQNPDGSYRIELLPGQVAALFRRLGVGTPRYYVSKTRDQMLLNWDAALTNCGIPNPVATRPLPPPPPPPPPPLQQWDNWDLPAQPLNDSLGGLINPVSPGLSPIYPPSDDEDDRIIGEDEEEEEDDCYIIEPPKKK